MHVHYAGLLNAAHETRRHLGRDELAVRGSSERVAMVCETLDHLIEVERMSRGTGDRHFLAWTLGSRGQAMLAWGMPWDAFAVYRQSERADSTGNPSMDSRNRYERAPLPFSRSVCRIPSAGHSPRETGGLG
jgi:hypothetical protein